tara:strand:- start:923 stop:1099 length:177 start_codon:yes stop_codon:yes gene_type:complete
MKIEASYFDDDSTEQHNPLDRAAAGLPPVIGGGCLARFDPQALNEQSGVDFAQVSDAD